MNRRWMWLWSLSLANLLALVANGPVRPQGPDKGDPKGETGTRTVSDELIGSEQRDKVRVLSPHKWYDHQMVKGKTYLIDLKSKDFDAYLRLEDAKGVQVAADDDSGGDLNAQIAYRAEATGTYRIYVTGFGKATKGKFTLTVREVAVRAAKAENLNVNDGTTTFKNTVTDADGTDERGRHYKAYAFAGKAAKLYRVEMAGLPDAQLRLLDDKGQVLRQSVKGPKGVVVLGFIPHTDGLYQLQAGSGRSATTGEFSLSITAATPPKTSLTPIDAGKPVKLANQFTKEDGYDQHGKHRQAYEFQAEAGKEYRFEARGQADPMLRVEDPTGMAVQEEDYGDAGYSHLVFRPAKTGKYHLVVAAGRPEKTGAFTLTGGERTSLALPLTVQEGPLKVGGQVTADDELDAEARYQKTYAFKAEQGKIYRFVAAGDFAPYLRVEAELGLLPKGMLPGPADFGGPGGPGIPAKPSRTIVPNKTGTYYLIVGAPVGRMGDFTLTSSQLKQKPAVPTDPKFKEVTIKVATQKGTITEEDGINQQNKPYQLIVLRTEPKKFYDIKMNYSSGQAQMRLEGMKGEVIRTANPIGGAGPTLGMNYAAIDAGEFRIALIGSLDQSIKYTLTITETDYTPPKITVVKLKPSADNKSASAKYSDSVVAGEDGVNATGQPVQYYQFKAVPKKLYDIQVSLPPNAFNQPQVRLEGLKGEVYKTAQFAPNNTQVMGYTTGQDVEVRVAIIGFLGQQIPYNLSIAETDYTPAKVTVVKLEPSDDKKSASAKFSDTVTAQDGLHATGQPGRYYQFKAVPSKRYDVVLSVPPNVNHPQLRLEGLKGEVYKNGQGTPNNTQVMSYTTGQDAEVRVAVIGYLGQQVSYNLTITEMDYTPPKVTVVKFEPSADKKSATAKFSEMVTQQDGLHATGNPARYYQFKAVPKKLYDIQVSIPPNTFNQPQVRLEGMKGEVLRNAQSKPNNTQSMTYSTPEDVEVRVAVIGFAGQQVPFTLTITEAELPKITVEKLVVTADKGAVISNELTAKDVKGEINKYHKVYSFEAKEGLTYQIDLHSTAFDAYLYLKDDKGVTLMENDDNGESLDSRIIYTMKKSGTYIIIATTLPGGHPETGAYTLTVRQVAGPK